MEYLVVGVGSLIEGGVAPVDPLLLHFILVSRHWEHLLKEEVQQNQRIELQVRITLTLNQTHSYALQHHLRQL